MIPSIDEKYHTKDELISAPWRYVDPSFSKPYNVLFLVQERRNITTRLLRLPVQKSKTTQPEF